MFTKYLYRVFVYRGCYVSTGVLKISARVYISNMYSLCHLLYFINLLKRKTNRSDV